MIFSVVLHLLDEVAQHLLALMSKSAMTPSFIGRSGGDVARGAPEHALASSPTARTLRVEEWIATTGGFAQDDPLSLT